MGGGVLYCKLDTFRSSYRGRKPGRGCRFKILALASKSREDEASLDLMLSERLPTVDDEDWESSILGGGWTNYYGRRRFTFGKGRIK